MKLRANYILFLIGLSFIPLTASSFPRLINPVNYQINAVSNYPVNFTGIAAPYLSSRSAIVIDADSKAIIYQKNPDLKLAPASLTKIMTALVAINNYSLNDLVTVGKIETDPYLMKLQPGEIISVENLLYGLLVASNNDAAIALAEFHPGGEADFIAAMNQKAKALNLKSTQFTNVVGFDNYGHYSTVHDLSLLAAAAMNDVVFSKIVGTAAITVSNTTGQITHELKTINELLGKIPGLVGVKTGSTLAAGECLISYVERNSHKIITVVLGSGDRFNETRMLIDWVFLNYRWEELPATH